MFLFFYRQKKGPPLPHRSSPSPPSSPEVLHPSPVRARRLAKLPPLKTDKQTYTEAVKKAVLLPRTIVSLEEYFGNAGPAGSSSSGGVRVGSGSSTTSGHVSVSPVVQSNSSNSSNSSSSSSSNSSSTSSNSSNSSTSPNASSRTDNDDEDDSVGSSNDRLELEDTYEDTYENFHNVDSRNGCNEARRVVASFLTSIPDANVRGGCGGGAGGVNVTYNTTCTGRLSPPEAVDDCDYYPMLSPTLTDTSDITRNGQEVEEDDVVDIVEDNMEEEEEVLEGSVVRIFGDEDTEGATGNTEHDQLFIGVGNLECDEGGDADGNDDNTVQSIQYLSASADSFNDTYDVEPTEEVITLSDSNEDYEDDDISIVRDADNDARIDDYPYYGSDNEDEQEDYDNEDNNNDDGDEEYDNNNELGEDVDDDASSDTLTLPDNSDSINNARNLDSKVTVSNTAGDNNCEFAI